jgi:hypothetical protein
VVVLQSKGKSIFRSGSYRLKIPPVLYTALPDKFTPPKFGETVSEKEDELISYQIKSFGCRSETAIILNDDVVIASINSGSGIPYT